MDRDLNDARFFAEVVDHGSFSAAARAARVPVSTVSRRIARLEARLGIALLVRTTRRLALTDAGRVFHERAARAVAELDAGERLVRDLGAVPRGRLRITAKSGVAALVWPALSEFRRRCPEVEVELDAHERRVDLIEERYDLAIWTGTLEDASVIARKILEGTDVLVAAPAYLDGRGRPRTVRELAAHDCIVVGDRARHARWTLRGRRGTAAAGVRGRVAVNEPGLARLAALDGHGIAKLPAAMTAPDVRAGRLERVLPGFDSGPVPAWLVYPQSRAMSAALRALVDYLVERLPALYARLAR
jgi:DNA-binding transcriptional LysR family regulator